QRAANPAEAKGNLVDRLELGPGGQAAERLEVGIPVRSDVLRPLDVIEPPRELALEGHRHAEEGVRDAGVAPVEEEVATVADEDLPVVKIVVLDRLGHAWGRKAFTELGDRLHEHT